MGLLWVWTEQESRRLCHPPPPVAHTREKQMCPSRQGIAGDFWEQSEGTTTTSEQMEGVSCLKGGAIYAKSPSALLPLLHAQHVKRQAVPQIKKDCYCISNPLKTAEVPARSCTSSCSHLLRAPAGWSCWGGNRLCVKYPDCSGGTDDTAAHCLPCPTFPPSGQQDLLHCRPCSGGVPPCAGSGVMP